MSRRELFGSMCAMVFLVNLARMVFAPLIQPAATEFGVTAASLGIVASAAWLGSASPRLPTGYLLTLVPRHYVLTITGSLLVFTSLFTGAAQSVPHLTAGAYLMGLSSGMYFIAGNPLVSELFPEGVGRAIGIHGMSSELAAVTAPVLLSGILLFTNWRAIFVVIAVPSIVATAFLVFAARRAELPDAGTEDRSLVVAIRAQWPLILTGLAVVGAVGFLWNGFFNLYGDYLDIAKGIEPGTGRLLLSGMFAAGIPAFFISGELADRLPNVPLFLGVASCFTLSVFTLTVVEGVIAIAVLSILVGFFMFGIVPVIDTYLLTSLPDHHRGSAYAMYSSSMMLIQALGSGTIGMAVVRGMSYAQAFRTVCVLVGAVLAILFVLDRLDRLPAGGRPDGALAAAD